MCTRVTPLLNEPSSNLAEKWTELEWQAMWYSGAFGTTFRTVSGSLVEIIQFGFWNREPGPDFVHASLRMDGEQLVAAAEPIRTVHPSPEPLAIRHDAAQQSSPSTSRCAR